MILNNSIIDVSHIEAEELQNKIGNIVKIHGSIYKIRLMSGFAFVILRTKRAFVQCIYSKEYTNIDIDKIIENSSVIITGYVAEEIRSKLGYELRINDIEILSIPIDAPPVVINNNVIPASLETILDFRPITIRNEHERAIFKLQEGICRGIREFLFSNLFTEIHSPKIVYAGAEGGANIFKLDYFGKEAYLAQSPQFYKQMLVGAYERVFEIAPVYRAEKHDTSRHLNEYISVDFEIGFIENFTDIMCMETNMIKFVIEFLKEKYVNEIKILKIELPNVTEIPCITFCEAKELVRNTYNRKTKDLHDFEPEEERLLCDIIKKEYGSDFVFVTHYPSSKRPFYAMEDNENPEVTLSFDLLFRGIEITTGGQRIHDYEKQIEKMKKRDMNIELFESYLMMHKYGMPPHGGLGLGLERFTMCLLNETNVRYASMFPRDMKRLTP
jgi:nondiscriminating aspartyl-tRNA synthetase